MRFTAGSTALRSIVWMLVAAAAPVVAEAQSAQITGTVRDASTGNPLPTVQVHIQGTAIGNLSTATGTFTLSNVAPGTYTIIAQRLGYVEARQTDVVVGAGATVSLIFEMNPAVLSIQGVVATGLVDPVEGVRSPITVASVTREMMPVVTTGDAVQNLQGRIAGIRVNRASGQPGNEVTMMLRTPTSITQSGAPMIVVDGVILTGTSTVDIEAMDIESMEVIKGAAAASLYGSRASAGVIAITTARGQGLDIGQTRFTARSEIGISQGVASNYLAKHHRFLMDPTNSFFVDQNGNRVDRNSRVSPALNQAFNDKPYPDQTYDNIGAILRPGMLRSNNLGISGNSASTNFAVMFNSYRELGALQNNDGYTRNSLRLNLDHRFLDAIDIGTSMYHARDSRDNIPHETSLTGQGNPFNQALQAPIDIDFTRKNESGQFLQQPDPTVAYQNPLWTQATRDFDQHGTRTLMGVTLGWRPSTWLTASARLGYDRSDFESRLHVPKGTPNNIGTDGTRDGSLRYVNRYNDTFNGETQVSLRRDFGPLNLRTTFRGLLERSDTESGVRQGNNFVLFGVPQFSNIRVEDITASSDREEIRSTGYLWDSALDYDGKYIFTVLGRRDGSSLFGPDNRWHNYYRVAGAWRLGEERWFNVPHVSEFKISYARGTAGGRPAFDAQYETWALTGGIPTKQNLGNRFLAPEHTLEQEVSLNAILFDKIGLVVTHAWQETTDQLVRAPQSVITGYGNRWVNAGTVAGYTTEIELEAQLIQRANFGWTTMFVGDRSFAEIKEWSLPCDATNAWRYYCTGEPVYGLYSLQLVESIDQLMTRHRGGDAAGHLDEFQINDEGLVVWVGKGNSYQDGIAKGLWGTVSGDIGGRTYEWGMPFWEQNEQGQNLRQLIGTSNPLNLGWINNIRLGAFNFHAQMHASIGGDANNRIQHTLVNSFQAAFMDQAGKPDGLKKPVAYYQHATRGDGSYTVHDASFLKLRTLSGSYTFNRAALERAGFSRMKMSNLSVGLVVRNVFTLSKYQSWDPEAALNLNTRVNSDAGGYPPTRSFTAEFSVTF